VQNEIFRGRFVTQKQWKK